MPPFGAFEAVSWLSHNGEVAAPSGDFEWGIRDSSATRVPALRCQAHLLRLLPGWPRKTCRSSPARSTTAQGCLASRRPTRGSSWERGPERFPVVGASSPRAGGSNPPVEGAPGVRWSVSTPAGFRRPFPRTARINRREVGGLEGPSKGRMSDAASLPVESSRSTRLVLTTEAIIATWASRRGPRTLLDRPWPSRPPPPRPCLGGARPTLACTARGPASLRAYP
jgi:hypothetical protein